jgi:hypothetical protein
VAAVRLEGVVGPKKSLNDSSQGGGDVWYPLESGHQGDGIGVLGMSAYTTFLPSLIALLSVCLVQWVTTILSVDAEYPT